MRKNEQIRAVNKLQTFHIKTLYRGRCDNIYRYTYIPI